MGENLRLKDPLSDVTRKERRALLGLSMLSIAIAKTGVIPSKISALGIEFGQTDQKMLLNIISLIVIYYLVAFIVYAASDFVSWRISIFEAIREARIALITAENKMTLKNKIDEESFKIDYINKEKMIFYFSSPISIIRALFEFALPVIIGSYSVFILLSTSVIKVTS